MIATVLLAFMTVVVVGCTIVLVWDSGSNAGWWS